MPNASREERPASPSWTGALGPELLRTLVREAAEMARPGHEPFAFRVLARGLLVAARREPNQFRRQIRVARKEPAPTDDVGRQRWLRELAILAEKLEIVVLDGKTQPAPGESGRFYAFAPLEPEDEGKTVARLIELRYGEIRPGRALCAICAAETDWFAPGGVSGQRCNAHTSPKFDERQGGLFS